jgi:4-amino-4-deoxy-L-arabinose transferase-like glycosyltransferase
MISIPVSTRPDEQKSKARARSEQSYELWTVLAALTLLYAVAALAASHRFVWFDELYTFDLARAKTIPLLWQLIRRFDFQPPAVYLLSRYSMELFGQSPFGLRLPSMLEFYVGSVALFFFVRRKVGISYATAGVFLLWLGVPFQYATEAYFAGILQRPQRSAILRYGALLSRTS